MGNVVRWKCAHTPTILVTRSSASTPGNSVTTGIPLMARAETNTGLQANGKQR